MATITEAIKIVTALVPSYDGTPEKLPSVVDALEVVSTIITDANKQTIINVILTKLEGKARHAFTAKPETIPAIILKLKEIAIPVPPETLIAKLSACKQKNNLNDFVKEIETLAMQLESAYIAKQIPNEVAKDLATKEAVKHMAAGLKTDQTKLVLMAGNYTQLSQAINKVLEINPTLEQNNSVLLTRAAHENKNQNKTETYKRNERFVTRDTFRNNQGQGRNGPPGNNEGRWQRNSAYQQNRFINNNNFASRNQASQWTSRYPSQSENGYRRGNFYNPQAGAANRQQMTGYRQQFYPNQQGYGSRPNNVYFAENIPAQAAQGHAACVSQISTGPIPTNQIQQPQQIAQQLMQQQRQ